MHNGGIVGEEVNQGLTRRDLLRRGVVLGGAVIWTTPVVQTLGMGRAFAQTASPIEGGKDISYLVLAWSCDSGETWSHTKFNENGTPEAGQIPDCGDKVTADPPDGLGSTAANDPGFGVTVDGPCATITIPSSLDGCTVVAFLKAGSAQSTTDPCQGPLPVTSGVPVCTS
jgi:hypothetical protein